MCSQTNKVQDHPPVYHAGFPGVVCPAGAPVLSPTTETKIKTKTLPKLNMINL